MSKRNVSSSIEILDRVLFRIVPGICFLLYAFRLVWNLDTQFRASEQLYFIFLMYILAVPFFASIVWWIFMPHAFVRAPEKMKEDGKNFLTNICLFGINFGSLIFFGQSQNYLRYFSDVGIFMYVSVFLADIFFIIGLVLKEAFFPQHSGTLSPKKWIILSVYFAFGLLFPGIFIMYKFFVQLLAEGVSHWVFISVFGTFIVKVLSRYLKQHTEQKML